ncbi:dnaJ homolog subfamily C member 30, mitochondrial-like [Euwallacea fornicatus]|uniref:dnaJ homolog subfamily C member 30, mitochondrial-like n=1 Tax=Euwallacea fornicatus TaxID=995702 RepID=UPI00338FADDD
MNSKLSIFVLSQIRKISTTSRKNQQKSYYDSLGITKSATQTEIKGAYYKLSKVYHPDRNHGETVQQREEHSQKFRDITDAYEILGNVKSRKLYDKGFLSGSSKATQEQPSPEDPLQKFYQSREVRTRPPPSDGRQHIYDFDEWARVHYGETVRKMREMKARKIFHANQHKLRKSVMHQEMFAYGGLVLLFLCCYIKHVLSDGDIPKVHHRQENIDKAIKN